MVHKGQSSSAAIFQSANLYLYTMHNPVMWLDPSGLFVIPWRDFILPPPPEVIPGLFVLIPPSRAKDTKAPGQSGPQVPANSTGGGGSGTSGGGTSAPKPPPKPIIIQAQGAIRGSTAANAPPQIQLPGSQASAKPKPIATSQTTSVTTQNSLPRTGPSNSTAIRVDANGQPITIRHYGLDGRALVDIHHGHTHHHSHIPQGQPRWHSWNWSNPATAHPNKQANPMSTYFTFF